MPGLLTDSRKLFGTDDLYEVLKLQRTASKAEVKKAYYRLSLAVHPDRVEQDKAGATKKFQTLGKIYSVLSDDDKRALYDETGSVDDEEICDKDRNWADYWRLLFPKLSVEDIEEFESKYKGSAEERADIISAYTKYEGDMEKIMNSVLCSTIGDEPRYRSIISDLIDSGKLPAFEAFVNDSAERQTARKRKAEREAKEAERALAKMKKSKDAGSLEALILRNQKSREEAADDFFKQMEAKYGGGSNSPSKRSRKSKHK